MNTKKIESLQFELDKLKQENIDLKKQILTNNIDIEKYHLLIDESTALYLEINDNMEVLSYSPSFYSLVLTDDKSISVLKLKSFLSKKSVSDLNKTFKKLHKQNLKQERLVLLLKSHFLELNAQVTFLKKENNRKVYFVVLKPRVLPTFIDNYLFMVEILQHMTEAVSIMDLDGNLIFANRSWVEMHGYNADELTGRNIKIFHTEKQMQDEFLPLREKCLENGFASGLVGHISAQNKIIYSSMNTSLLIDSNEQAIGFIAFAKDVSKEREAKLKNAEQREFIFSVIQSLPHPFRVLDAEDYSIQMENLSAKKFQFIFGKEKCNSLNSIVTDIDTIKVKSRTIIPFEELKTTGSPVISEYQDNRQENDNHYYEVHCYPLFDKDGRLERIIEYDLDITARKRVSEKIKEREEELQLLSDNFSIGMAILFDEAVSWVNKAFIQTFEYQRRDILSKTLSGIILSSEYPAFIEYVNEIIKNNEDFGVFETAGVTRSGKCIHLAINIKEIRFGEKAGIQLLFEDITERKNAENVSKIQHDLALRLAASMNLDETLNFCVVAALNACKMEAGGIYLKDKNSGHLKPAHYSGFAEDIVTEFTINAYGKTLASQDYKDKMKYYNFADLKKCSPPQFTEEVKSLSILPLMHEKDIIGCITLVSHTLEIIPEANKNTLEAVVAQIGSSMSRLITEEALKQNEELFRTLYENISDLIIILERDYTIRFISGSVQKISGYSPVEIMIKGFFSIIDKHDVDSLKGALEKAIDNPGMERIQRMRIITKAGVQKILESVIVNHFEKPYIKGIILDSRDVTERIEAEDAVRESEQRYRSLVESAIDPIFIVHDGKIIFANNAFQEILGYSANELAGKEIIDFLSGDIAIKQYFLKIISNVLSGKLNEIQFETQFVSKNNLTIDLIAGGSSEVVAGKRVFLCMMKDITDKKKAESEREKLIKALEQTNSKMEKAYETVHNAYEKMEIYQNELKQANEDLQIALGKAEEASKQKSEFLAVISHELRTPLTGILGFSELLKLGKITPLRCQDFGERINRLGKKLLDIINDLLELSIIEAGKVKIFYSEFNINEMVEDVYSIFEEQFTAKNLLFNRNLEITKSIYSDPVRIRQILLNLIGNAVKFTASGEINVEINQNDDNYIFSVTDTGIGIGREEQNVIFDMFRQVEGTSSRKYSGSGIGLAICSKLLRILKGEIWVESELGKGSTFFFSIPVRKKPGDCQFFKEKKAVFAQDFEAYNLLFAEDDENTHQYMIEVLKLNKDCVYKGFFDGLPLIEEFKNNPHYDIVLLDIQLKEMNGFEVLNAIRKINKRIPVIAVSAFTMEKDREKYLSYGFTDFISKPIDMSSFFKKIKEAVNRNKKNDGEF